MKDVQMLGNTYKFEKLKLYSAVLLFYLYKEHSQFLFKLVCMGCLCHFLLQYFTVKFNAMRSGKGSSYQSMSQHGIKR